MTRARDRPHHLIDPEHFRALARGGGDERVARSLWVSERSWRLVVLRTFLDVCADLPGGTGPLPALTSAWDLLAQAYAADPSASEEVLSQPQVGIWAAYTIRRAGRSAGTVPLWMDVGYLHVLAVACAARAGLSFELVVPVRHGVVALPTVGAATFPGDLTHAGVRGKGGSLEFFGDGTPTILAGPEDPRWQLPARVVAEAGGARLGVTLLDRDLYRDLRRPSPPKPLKVAEVDRWRAVLGQAWRILISEQPERASAIASIVRTLTPVAGQTRYRQLSASGAEAFGGILLSDPEDATELAVTLVHEAQHQKLGALLHLLTLTHDEPGIRYYAPWRDDPRPLSGLLQGTYAFAGVADFWRTHHRRVPPDEVRLAQFEFALWRRQTLHAARVLARSGRLTAYGEQFVEVLLGELAAWQDDPVPADIVATTEDMALDHHALWRAFCMPVDAAVGAALSNAFRRGEPPPAAALSETDQRVVRMPETSWYDGRAVLVRHRLSGRPVTADLRIEGTTGPDLDLVSGNVAQARTRYLEALERDRTDAHAWTGLGLTLDRSADPARRALLGRPELLVVMTTDGADPLAVARWLGEALPEDLLGRPRRSSWIMV